MCEVWHRDVRAGYWRPEGYIFRDPEMAIWWCECMGGGSTLNYQVRDRVTNAVLWDGARAQCRVGNCGTLGRFRALCRVWLSTPGAIRCSRVFETLRKRIAGVGRHRASGR